MAAPTTAKKTPEPESPNLSSLPLTDHFAAVIDEYREQQDAPVFANVDLHAGDGNGLGVRIARWSWEEFDEQIAARQFVRGRNVFVLRIQGVRRIMAQRIVVAAYDGPDAAKAPAPADSADAVTPPTPTLQLNGTAQHAPPSPTLYGPEMVMTLLMQMMQSQADAARASAERSAEQNNELMRRFIEATTRPQDKSTLEQLLELDDALERRAGRRGDAGEASILAEALSPLSQAIAETLKSRPQVNTAPPSKTVTLPSSTPNAQPPAAPAVGKSAAMLADVASLLEVGSGRPDAEPSAYASVVWDKIIAHGFNPVQVFEAIEPGQLTANACERVPHLRREFVQGVEDELRSLAGSADDTEPEPE